MVQPEFERTVNEAESAVNCPYCSVAGGAERKSRRRTRQEKEGEGEQEARVEEGGEAGGAEGHDGRAGGVSEE